MFKSFTFKSLKYYVSNFFRGAGRGWTRSVVRLPDVKGKNIIGPLPTNLLRCEVKIAQIPEAKAEHLLKANSYFFNDNRMR